MQTLVIHAAQDLRIEDHPMPVPGPGQVLIRIARGGICGSDLHYYHHGGFGPVRLREPMILGHEVAGVVEELGPDVMTPTPGQLVAVSPSRPCKSCRYCLEGQPNQCLNMRFYGSAMPFPHIQGAFREYLVADVDQCAVADGLSAGEAAMAEPLAVALHAVRQAGDVFGRRVLVTGCGPIGVLVIIAARLAGAAEIVATDLSDFTLAMARSSGADRTIDVGQEPAALAEYGSDKGYFDAHLECSGAPQALSDGIGALRPGGTLIQLGLGGDMTVPMQALTAKELTLRGSFRFHQEFFTGVDMMRAGRIRTDHLLTETVPLTDATAGFDAASDRSRSMKVQISFS